MNRVTWLGHSTVLLELGGTRLLTDPVLRGRLAHLVRVSPAVDPAAYERLDAVLISHLHHDHLDEPSLRLIDRSVRLVVPRGAGPRARRLRFEDVVELGAGEEASVGEVVVTAVDAVHNNRRIPGGDRAQPIGFLVAGGGARIYFAGDTDLFEGMAELADPPLDIALLPVWGWGPWLGPGHLDPAGAARAAALLRPRIAVPIHWGTLYPRAMKRLMPRQLHEPPERFRELVTGMRVEVLEPGGSLELG